MGMKDYFFSSRRAFSYYMCDGKAGNGKKEVGCSCLYQSSWHIHPFSYFLRYVSLDVCYMYALWDGGNAVSLTLGREDWLLCAISCRTCKRRHSTTFRIMCIY